MASEVVMEVCCVYLKVNFSCILFCFISFCLWGLIFCYFSLLFLNRVHFEGNTPLKSLCFYLHKYLNIFFTHSSYKIKLAFLRFINTFYDTFSFVSTNYNTIRDFILLKE